MTASGPFSNKAPDADQKNASESDAVKHNFPHPLTPCGIVAYTTAERFYFIATILLFAVICSASICILVNRCLVQPINIVAERLPDEGGIIDGKLFWLTNEPAVLIETRSFSIHVNPTDEEPIADGADLQVVFGKEKLLLRSLFGWLILPYPETLNFPLNLKEVWTTWGAYKNSIIPVTFLIFACLLVLVWWMLAWLYSIPISIFIKILRRKIDPIGVFRISLMSQMLPAAILSSGIILYAYNRFDLTTLLILFIVHIPFAWIYLIISPFYLPGLPEDLENPFSDGDKSRNPFTSVL